MAIPGTRHTNLRVKRVNELESDNIHDPKLVPRLHPPWNAKRERGKIFMNIPTYGELLKLVWFLVWRHVVILMFVSMTIGWGVPVILNITVPSSSTYILEFCIYGVLFFGITPFILKTLFQKQFQGFQVIFQRETGSTPLSSI